MCYTLNFSLGIYRPPVTRRRVLCPLTGGLNTIPSPILRKASTPLMGGLNQTVNIQMPTHQQYSNKPKMVESGTQTISTGEITALNIYFENS